MLTCKWKFSPTKMKRQHFEKMFFLVHRLISLLSKRRNDWIMQKWKQVRMKKSHSPCVWLSRVGHIGKKIMFSERTMTKCQIRLRVHLFVPMMQSCGFNFNMGSCEGKNNICRKFDDKRTKSRLQSTQCERRRKKSELGHKLWQNV